jgi:hypothetical protein
MIPATTTLEAPSTIASPAARKAPAQPAFSVAEIATLLARGDSLFATDDVVAARLLYERAADAGEAGAAVRLGETFDPRRHRGCESAEQARSKRSEELTRPVFQSDAIAQGGKRSISDQDVPECPFSRSSQCRSCLLRLPCEGSALHQQPASNTFASRYCGSGPFLA